MAKKMHEIGVRVEIDYDKLADAIRSALRDSMTITTRVPGDAAARRAVRELEWREGGRVK